MTERERFIKTLRREPVPGHAPTFELVFFLTMEAFGRVHPSQAELYIMTARRYHHSAIFVHPNPGDFGNIVRLLEIIREKSGDEYFLMMHGEPTFSMPDGGSMMEFTERLYEDGDGLRSLRDGMARGAGFVFCTSNCAYTGLPLERYELMNRI